MNTFNRFIVSLGAMGLLATGAINAEAATISFSAPSNVTQGQSFSVDLIVSGLSSADLAGFSIDVTYDHSRLAFNSYSLGTELTDIDFGQEDLSLGATASGVNVGEVSWLLDFTNQPDSFKIATLTFNTIGAGLASLSFSHIDLTDPDGFPLSATIGAGVNVNVAPVPLPAGVWLLGSALMGLAGAARKKSQLAAI